ncbi:2-succinyl-5-enolpyruvyl-6-hydroxy-3-cyclohexene-1-carboxylic-acid synthase [Halalkalibaculum sp. DA3122]|uniref:2-succinyl-5-enolpyruvyl-6-hydroxy-3- cyclohexene-1-carboxylic-acid synthase n=1 Tax=unclassified Halalkalibaculum TaxID=2964617 RepID=UPI003754A6CA
METDKQNKAFFWATIFLRELYADGVSQVVISPGSRSTPLTMAAAVHPGFTTRTVLDERSAAYMALGMAKSAGVPAVLICTSGTAAANYFPAIIEARHSGVPLLVLTADRPPHLRNAGASQAIDQLKIYGDYPVFFHEAGEPVMEPEDIKRLKMAASQSVTLSLRRGGPAHVNFPFRKPLEPTPSFVEKIEAENRLLIDQSPAPQTSVFRTTGSPSVPDEIRSLISASARPVIVKGPGGVQPDLDPAVSLAEALSAPLLAEFPATGHPNIISGFDGFLRNRSLRQKLKPDLVLRFGMQPVSKALEIYLSAFDDIPHLYFGELEEWQDATHAVSHRLEGPGKQVGKSRDYTKADPGWIHSWKTAERTFNAFRQEQLEPVNKLGDGHVFYYLSRQIPRSWNVFLSNSFPVRDWMLFAGSPPHPTFVNRGASGIDGIISTSTGATLAGKKPGVLFIGDLAALHDSNALLSAAELEEPLVIVLLNNKGGNIFRMLPVYEHKKLYLPYFETPQNVNFRGLATAHNLPFSVIRTVDQLNQIQLTHFTTPGIHLLECKTDSKCSMELRHKLWNFSS